jgi:fatty acid amide hydrolase 2
VVISDDASILPVSIELRNARIRAAKALQAAGADVRRVSLPGIRTVVQPYLNAARESGGVREILQADGDDTPGLGRVIADAIRGRSHYSAALVNTLAAESVSRFIPDRLQRRAAAAERALAEEITETIGDGVLLHPPWAKLAPRHGSTVGRPWVLAPQAIFNLLGLPATAVPLGLNDRGQPLGVQVAAGRDRDHVSIAVALELERAFGGWVPPSGE